MIFIMLTLRRLGAEFGKAHKEVFGKFPPVSTMVEIKQLLHKGTITPSLKKLTFCGRYAP